MTVRAATPWPFVQALAYRYLVFELLALLFAIVVLSVWATGDRLEAFFSSDLAGGAERDRLEVMVSIQLVSIAGATCAMAWYWHLTRMLRGSAAWSYPSLASRVRSSVLLLAVVFACAVMLVSLRWHTWPEALALSTLGGAWAAWPLLSHLPGGLWVRSAAMLTPVAATMLPATSQRLADGLLPWFAAMVGVLAIAGLTRGISSSTVRAMVTRAQPDPRGAEWRHVDDDADAAELPGAAFSVGDRVRAIERLLLPRWPVRSWIPRWVRSSFAHLHGMVAAAIWFVIGAEPSMLLLSFANVETQPGAALWLPLGRQERLAVARAAVQRRMALDGALTIGTLVALEALQLPRLPIGMSGTPLVDNWLPLPLLIAVLPMVYVSSITGGLMRSRLRQVVRVVVAMLAVNVVAQWGVRHDAPEVVLVVAILLLGLTLLEQRWRLTRHFAERDLHAAPSI